ncbi:MAG: amino acid adenylation domain-containing protein [Calditrichaeota bacterium]|nr:amino acid adenylation domain-containing protein [Calditrichota bacterium]
MSSSDKKKNIEAIYPLSPMQQGMLFHSIYNEGSGEYFEQFHCKIHGDLKRTAFERALNNVVHRHSALRTAFVWKKVGKMLQVVHKEVSLPLAVEDWSSLPEAEQAQKLDQLLQDDRARGMNVAKAPLMRFYLIKLSENAHRFYWAFHHLLTDGWSIPVILKEVFILYEAYSKNFPMQLPPARPYVDYINWLQKQDLQKAETYWKALLADYSAPVALPEDRVTESLPEDYKKIERPLSKDMSERLNAFARKNQLTINTLVQGAWAILHNRYAGADDIVFGATVSGRPPELPDVERMVGLFINTLPICATIDQQRSSLQWLKSLQRQAVEMRDYEYTPLVDIHGWSSVPRDMPLFNSIVVYENYPVDSSMKDQRGSLQFSDFHTNERTNYPLTLVAGFSDKLVLEIAYETKRYEQQTVERYLQHLERILTAFAGQPEQKLANISLMDDEELKKITVDWNAISGDFDLEKCVHQFFEQQVQKCPDAMAVTFGKESITYNELNERANQLAHLLCERGIGVEDRVAIYLERSIEMIISMLAVMKAGGAYVPIDPEYPTDRVVFIIKDSEVKIAITDTNLSRAISNINIDAIDLRENVPLIEKQPRANLDISVVSDNCAYVIYTSGSTGKPKGTLLQHSSVVNQVHAVSELLGYCTFTNASQFASIAFDASVIEIFSSLITGCNLFILDSQTRTSVEKIKQFFIENSIEVGFLPNIVLSEFYPFIFPNLQILWTGGDVCTQSVADRCSRGNDFLNLYGPTEITVSCTAFKIQKNSELNFASIPIGRPVANYQLYILDSNDNILPIGAPGELCIGGVGLARGYLGRPALTAEKFIPNPFSRQPGARMYRSGDLVRWLPDGNLEFLGRIDHQVKIRGFRIELGEIESVLSSHPDVLDAVVLAKEHSAGQKILVGYYIPKNDADIDTQTLQSFISKKLPDYMTPSIFIRMDSFLLTSSGKVNRRALSESDMQDFTIKRKIIEPRSQVEEILLGIWQNILNVEKISVLDSFFELGGHSLMATQLISRVRDAFGIELPLREFFEKPTIAELSLIIEQEALRQNLPPRPPLEPTSRPEYPPLSFAQQRLWFLNQLAPNQAFYNIPGAFRLSGALDLVAFEKSIREIMRRHESLRTTFADERGEPYQVVHEDIPLPIEKTDLSSLPTEEQRTAVEEQAMQEAKTPFDLSKGPLFRVRLLILNDSEHVVVFNMHHIISDGWSVGVLVNEFAQLYNAFVDGEASPLDELPVQYIDFALWQRNWLQGETLQQQLAFWKENLGVNPQVLELPTDRPRPPMQTFNGDNVASMLPKELSQRLSDYCRKEGVTPFMFLLAVFQTLLYRYSGQDEILVGSPIANRTHSETEKLIGFFVNTLVLKSDFTDAPDFRTLLRRVRETTLNAYAHQDVPFEQLVDTLQPERDMSHSPLFQVAFILQNTPLQKLELPGLTLSPVQAESKTAKYDLTLNTAETEEGIACNIEFNTDLFDRGTAKRMLHHFRELVQAALQRPKEKVSQLPLMSDDDLHKILVDWNESDAPWPTDRTVPQLFQEWVQKQPAAEAVRFGEEFLTYAELNRRANQLANYVLKKGVDVDDIVGISMKRSPDVAVAVLGILKAGAAFLNIDPTYPQERIGYMLRDSGVSVLLSQQNVTGTLPSHDAEVICIDRDWPVIAEEKEDDLPNKTTPDNLAYVIYTSGSTGKPKGTLLPHRGLCNLHRAQRSAFHIEPSHRVLQFAPLSFDASVWETVMALLNGACLVYADQETLASGQGLRDVLKEQRVNIVTLPPSVLAVMPDEELPDLKTIVTAGEACSLELVQRWGRGRQYVNAYGPTETSVCASYYEASPDDASAPPIGKPLRNFQLYVLDKNWTPVPEGVPGELCVGGVGLARGYLNRPDLTVEKFIPNPFAKNPGERLYRTGDLVRWLPDGNMEFLGRIDHQVKVRGFRIELGEIEAVLSRVELLQDVFVMVREDTPGDQRIVAYLVADETLDVAELHAALSAELPDYMIPSAFVVLDEFPLTPSGKIDRKALPKPEFLREQLGSEYVAPRSDTEEKLVAIVSELLNVEQVGVHDNFFKLGGHSLLATQFISRVGEAFDVEIPLISIFEKPTVAELAEIVAEMQENDEASKHEKIKRIEPDESNDILSHVDELTDEELRLLLEDEDGENID